MFRLLKILKGLGSLLLIFDTEPFKYKYRIGLETLVVYTVNQWALYFLYFVINIR